MEVRSNRFNYNSQYTGQRFYTFSTWTDDITQSFLTASNTMEAPCAFLAFKLPSETDKPYNVEKLISVLENYYENKLAYLRKNYISNNNISSNEYNEFFKYYSPLYYLFDALKLAGIDPAETSFLLEDICEQNYNGTFTDILCTIPHGTTPKKILIPKSYPEIYTFKSDPKTYTAEHDITSTLGSGWHTHVNPDIKGTEYSAYSADEKGFDADITKSDIIWDQKDTEDNKQNIASLYDESLPHYIRTGHSKTDHYTIEFLYNKPKSTELIKQAYTKYIILEKDDSIVIKSDDPKFIITGLTFICKLYKGTTEAYNTYTKNAKVMVKTNNQEIADIETYEKTEDDSYGFTWHSDSQEAYGSEISVRCLSSQCAVDRIILTVKEKKTQEFGVIPKIEHDTLLGWTQDAAVIYDSYNTKTKRGEYWFKHNSRADIQQLEDEEKILVFVEEPQDSFEFNCIIPLYKRFEKTQEALSVSSMNQLDLLNVKPLGIWINEMETDGETLKDPFPIRVNTSMSGDRYTASWSLSISAQIKPYYATNSIPVNYSSGTDVESAMQTFAGVLSKVQELGEVVQNYQKQLAISKAEAENPDLVSYMALMKQMKGIRNEIKEYDNALEQLRDENSKTEEKVENAIETIIVEKLTSSNASLTSYAKKDELSILRSDLNKNIEDLRSSIGSGGGTLDDAALASVLSTKPDYIEKVSGLSRSIPSYTLRTDVQYLDQILEEQRYEQEYIKGDIRAVRSDLEDVQNDIAAVQTNIANAQQAIVSNKNAIDTRLSGIDTQVANLNSSVVTLTGKVTSNTAGVSRNTDAIAGLTARTYNLEQSAITVEYLDTNLSERVAEIVSADMDLPNYATKDELTALQFKVDQDCINELRNTNRNLQNVVNQQGVLNTNNAAHEVRISRNTARISALEQKNADLFDAISESLKTEDGSIATATITGMQKQIDRLTEQTGGLAVDVNKLNRDTAELPDRMAIAENTIVKHTDQINTINDYIKVLQNGTDGNDITFNTVFDARNIVPGSHVVNPIGDITTADTTETLNGLPLSEILTRMLFPKTWTPINPDTGGSKIKHTVNATDLFSGIKNIYRVGESVPCLDKTLVNAQYNILTGLHQSGIRPGDDDITVTLNMANNNAVNGSKFSNYSINNNVTVAVEFQNSTIECTSNRLVNGLIDSKLCHVAGYTDSSQKKTFHVIYPTILQYSGSNGNKVERELEVIPGQTYTYVANGIDSTHSNLVTLYIPKMTSKAVTKLTDICVIKNNILGGWQEAGDNQWIFDPLQGETFASQPGITYWKITHNLKQDDDLDTLTCQFIITI